MRIAFSWDDGAPEDQKLFELHEKYDIPGIFFVPTHNSEGRKVITPEIIRNSESKNISFGGHTHNHIYLTSIPLKDVEEEVVNNKHYLEDTLGHSVDHFCFPGGKYTPEICDIVKKHFRTARTADTMNFINEGHLLKPTFHMYPRGKRSLLGNAIRNKSYSQALFLLTHFSKSYFDVIKELIVHESSKEASKIIIWGHSWEIEENDLWETMDQFFALVKELNKDNEYWC